MDERGLGVEGEELVDGRGDVLGGDGVAGGVGGAAVAGAEDRAAGEAAAGEDRRVVP